MINNATSLLYRTKHNVFYFQYRIPQKIRKDGNIKQLFFRKSLKTKDQKIAIRHSKHLFVAIDSVFEKYGLATSKYNEAQKLLQSLNFTHSIVKIVPPTVLKENTGENQVSKQQESKVSNGVINYQLTELIDKYINEAKRNWKVKTRNKTEQDYRPKIELFAEILSNKPPSSISYDDITSYKESLFNFPANHKKKKAYRNLSVKDLTQLKVSEKDCLSHNSLINHLGKVKAFLSWMYRNKYTHSDLCQPLQRVLKRKISEDEERDEFNENDLKRLFESKPYLQGLHNNAHQYWLPLLGVLQGGRQNEYCQLYINDVCSDQETNIWFIDHNEKEDKTLKEISHSRKVPVHSILIQLGFLDYVKQMKSQGYKRLFPELTKKRDGYSASFSKWFNNTYRNANNCNVGQVEGENKNFHSFRHTFINKFKQLGVEEWKVSQLVGHKSKTTGITYGRYGKKSELIVQKELIEKLKFDIDFNKIKKWQICH